jgi:hypothetical protein
MSKYTKDVYQSALKVLLNNSPNETIAEKNAKKVLQSLITSHETMKEQLGALWGKWAVRFEVVKVSLDTNIVAEVEDIVKDLQSILKENENE